MITAVYAVSQNWVFSDLGEIPWDCQRLRSPYLFWDRAHFKRITRNRPMIMGRHTYESMLGSVDFGLRKPLVVSKTTSRGISLEDAVEYTLPHREGPPDSTIIGGAGLLASAMDKGLVGEVWLTRFPHEIESATAVLGPNPEDYGFAPQYGDGDCYHVRMSGQHGSIPMYTAARCGAPLVIQRYVPASVITRQ